MSRVFSSLLFASVLAVGAVRADDSATPAPASRPPMTKHQMMEECMAKQKASDGGMPKEDMKRACKDVTSTERENEKTEKKEESEDKHDSSS